MVFGAAGLLLPSVPLLLAALFAMGVHSAFFGPIKYAILPQHLKEGEVLGGTGLVEAGTYAAILAGTIVGGIIPPPSAAGMVLMVAVLGARESVVKGKSVSVRVELGGRRLITKKIQIININI